MECGRVRVPLDELTPTRIMDLQDCQPAIGRRSALHH
jgi:hypothetical protein